MDNALTTALVGITVLAACSRAEPRLDSAAQAAAAESGVPAQLLLAIAGAESRGTTDGPGQWIRLMPWRASRDARLVAPQLGIAVDGLDDDPTASLRVAAALLADAARATGVDRNAPLSAWRAALERFAGGRDALANQLYADQVLTLVGVEPPAAAAAHLPERPADLVGAAFASYVPLSDAAHRPMSATQRHPRFIIVHAMQNTAPVVLEYFHRAGTKVGAHYLVDSVAGTTVQMADERLVVFHDACFNEDSIGIEHEGYVEAGKLWYSDEQLRASARLVRDIAARNGIALDREHILGHGEAPDCSDHTDPGPDWDWDRFMAYVAQPE